jgi:hypothetical protein
MRVASSRSSSIARSQAHRALAAPQSVKLYCRSMSTPPSLTASSPSAAAVRLTTRGSSFRVEFLRPPALISPRGAQGVKRRI